MAECDREASIMRWPRPTRGCCSMGRVCKEVGLEVNAGKTKYTFMSRQQNVGYNHDTKLENIGDSRLLGCYAVSPAKYLRMFPRIELLSSSGSAVHRDWLVPEDGGSAVPREGGAELTYLDLRGRK